MHDRQPISRPDSAAGNAYSGGVKTTDIDAK